MIYAMRPQKYIDGLPSEEFEKVVGKKIKQDLNKYDPISENILE
jgi:sialic acid synthase SpsE